MNNPIDKILKMYWQPVGRLDVGKTGKGTQGGFGENLPKILGESEENKFLGVAYGPFISYGFLPKGTPLSYSDLIEKINNMAESLKVNLTRLDIEKRYTIFQGIPVYKITSYSHGKELGHLIVKVQKP